MSAVDVSEIRTEDQSKAFDGVSAASGSAGDDPLSAFTPEQEKKLLRKIDIALIPWLSLLYLLSFLDRTSIGNASLYHMRTDLHLKDQQYLWALTIFFFSYAIFEVSFSTVNEHAESTLIRIARLIGAFQHPAEAFKAAYLAEHPYGRMGNCNDRARPGP